jgi:hypothetical protein
MEMLLLLTVTVVRLNVPGSSKSALRHHETAIRRDGDSHGAFPALDADARTVVYDEARANSSTGSGRPLSIATNAVCPLAVAWFHEPCSATKSACAWASSYIRTINRICA